MRTYQVPNRNALRSRARLRRSQWLRAAADAVADKRVGETSNPGLETDCVDDEVLDAPVASEVQPAPECAGEILEEAPAESELQLDAECAYEEELTEFVECEALAVDAGAGVAAHDVAEADDEPPFDLPVEDEADEPQFDPPAEEDDEPPFDPPDEDDEIFSGGVAPLDEEAVRAEDSLTPVSERPPALFREPERRGPERPAPAIAIHVSWDRAETADLCAALAADRRMARTDITHARGGLEGAINRYAGRPSPDLLIIETTLTAAELLAGVTRLVSVVASTTEVVVIGAVNDVGLLRELTQRGVTQYVLAPAGCDELVRAICALYTDTDNSRVVAIMGARGGVGASTIAYNLAWCIGERIDVSATLVDLDHAFSKAAFDEDCKPSVNIADGLHAPEAVDDGFLERVTVEHSKRFHAIATPPSLARELEFEPGAVKALVDKVRRTTSFVILDVPHKWSGWVREALLLADEVFIVAAPDLASMRNAKNIVDQLKGKRPQDHEPMLVLSMVGAPKRPEISGKDFAEAVGSEPVASFAFEPELFGLGEIKGRAIGEVAPHSQAAEAIVALGCLITGRTPVKRKPSAPSAAPVKRADKAANDNRRSKSADTTPPPFTFAPASDQAADNPDQPLILGDAAAMTADPPAPSASALRRARAAGELEHHKRSRGRPGTLRTAAALAALLLTGLWYAQSREDAAARAAMAAALTTPASAAPAPAVQAEDPIAHYESALALISEGDFQQGVSLLRRAAETGLPAAQYRLAKLYETGAGVEADLAMARRWTERAAASGDSRAMHDLGVYFARGEGGAQDDVEAFRWFRQAAEFGVAASQYNLGLLYQQGRGVTANPPEALFWFLLAAHQGDESAVARVAEVQPQLAPEQVEQAQARAEAFRPRPVVAP